MNAKTLTVQLEFPSSYFLDLENFKNKQDISNMCRWENIQYQRCLDQANAILDQMEKVRLLREAEDILIEEIPIISFVKI